MEEITRPNPARSYYAPPHRPHRHPLRTTLILGAVLVPLVCALTFAAAAYASTATIRLPPVDSDMLGQIAASFLPTPPSPIPPPTATPLSTFQPPPPTATPFSPLSASLASPTPVGSPSPTPTPTESETPTPTLTPTFTITPTFTATDTPTATASVTDTPTATRTPTHTPTSSSVPPTATDPPPTATNSPAPTATPPPTATPDPSCSPSGNASFESTLLGLINQERNDQGLPSYSSDSRLVAAALGHSTDMACNEFFSHTGSDGSSVGDRVTAHGYSWSWVGENIFATSDTSSNAPQAAFDWWMGSDAHRANLLSSNYQDIGIGYVYLSGSPYGGYFTAVFARP